LRMFTQNFEQRLVQEGWHADVFDGVPCKLRICSIAARDCEPYPPSTEAASTAVAAASSQTPS
jgi:endonuclease YncB( thermonuclease family)